MPSVEQYISLIILQQVTKHLYIICIKFHCFSNYDRSKVCWKF